MNNFFGYRFGSNQPKQRGYFDLIPTASGDFVTEYSASGNINNKKVDYPLVVPTLSYADLQNILKSAESNGNSKVDENVYNKAEDYAKYRMSLGQSPFWRMPEIQYKLPSPQVGAVYDVMQGDYGLLDLIRR